MFRLYLSHLQALKGQMHIISEQCIVGSQELTKIRLYNNIIISWLYGAMGLLLNIGDPTMHCSLIVWIWPLRA
jgi:hypothetical protein